MKQFSPLDWIGGFRELGLLVISLGIGSITPSLAFAKTLTWTGNAAFYNRWSEPGNWNPAGPPADGDTLVFPAGFTPINDISSVLHLHSIQFTGNGSTYLSGNPVSLDSDITAANNNGEARVSFDVTFSSGGGTFYTLGSAILNIEDNVFLANNQALNLYAFTANILVQGSIQGNADLVKLGTGSAYLLGNLVNTYTGTTYIQGGTLHLGKANNVVAISPKVVVGQNTTVIGRVKDDSLGQYPSALDMTLGPYGSWELADGVTVTNLSLVTSGPLGWGYPGASIFGTGLVNLDCDIHVTGTNVSELHCALYIGNQTRTFNVDQDDWTRGYLAVDSVVGTGSAGIVKDGLGAMYLLGPNDYAGLTLVHAGLLGVENNFALGASAGPNAGTIVDSGATLQFASVTSAEPLALGACNLRFSGTNALNGPVTLNGGLDLSGFNLGYFNLDQLQFNNVISGAGPIHMGGGVVRLAGPDPNTFTGGIVVGSINEGAGLPVTLELAKPNNVTAVPGVLYIENTYPPSSNSTILRNFQDNGVSDVRLGHVAQWLLNGHTVAPHSLTFYGDAVVDTQGGQLQMSNPPGTNRFFTIAPPFTPTYTAQILGTLSCLAPTDDLTVEAGPTLEVFAQVTGPGAFQKSGPGLVSFGGTAANTYTGGTLVNEGVLELAKLNFVPAVPGDLVIGPPPGGGSLAVARLGHSAQIAGAIITVNAGSLLDLNGNNEDVAQLNLNDGGDAQTGGGSLSFPPGSFVTVGSQSGSGSHAGSSITGTLGLQPNDLLTFNVSPYSASPPFDPNPELDVSAAIPRPVENLGFAPAGLSKTGSGQMRISGNNTYAGITFVNGGTLIAASPGALGSINGVTSVNNDASLALDGGVTINNESLYLGSTSAAALDSRAGANTWAGPINITSDSRINVNNSLSAYGIINGPGNLIKVGPGTLTLDGSGANVYAGGTFVNEGKLAMKKDQLNVRSIPHNVTVGAGSGGPPATLLNQNEGAIGGRVTVNDPGLWNLNNWQESFQSDASLGGPALTLNGAATVRSGGLSFLLGNSIVVNGGSNATATISSGLVYFYADTFHITVSPGVNQSGKPECLISGPLSQLLSPTGLLKDGAGTLRLTGTNTYTGTSLVTGGALWIDGVQPQSSVLIIGGTLGGFGIAGDIIMNGGGAVVAPGESPGILSCSNFNAGITGNGTFRVELNGTTPGSSYDQLNVSGTVNLSGVSLNASLGFASSPGDQFTIIANDLSDAISGTFTGLPQGKKLYIGQELFQINYTGGSGNDVVLTRQVTPPPPTLTIQRLPPASVRLLWPTNDPPFSLQTTTNLTVASWTNALPLPVVIGTNNLVTNAVTGIARFYRLSNP